MTVFPDYSAVGNKECLLEDISNITPAETPMFSKFGKVSITGVLPEWQTDTLRAAAANKHQQGFNYVSALGAVTPTALVTNRTQIVFAGYEVSKTQEAVSSAGRASEVAYQKAKAMKEIALDVEYAIVTNTTAIAAAAGVEGQMKGIPGFLAGNFALDADGAANATAILKDASAAALTQDILDDQLQVAWQNGAVAMQTIYTNAKQKRVIDSFQASTRRIANTETVLAGLVATYESNFGVFDIMLDRRIAADTMYILNNDVWKTAVLRTISSFDLPNTVSAVQFGMEGELSLICYSPESNTGIKNLG